MKPLILRSDLTNRWYIVTDYKEMGNGKFQAKKKYDVTEQIKPILDELRKSQSKIVEHLSRLDTSFPADVPHHLVVMSQKEYEDYLDKHPYRANEDDELRKLVYGE